MIPVSNNKLSIQPSREIDLGAHGGAELFFADINGDNEPEIIAYQGPAVFGARMFRSLPHVRALFPAGECVSAFNLEGKKLWTWGKTNPPGRPYISHAYESVISIGNIEGNGRPEVAVACGDSEHENPASGCDQGLLHLGPSFERRSTSVRVARSELRPPAPAARRSGWPAPRRPPGCECPARR